MVSVCLLCPKAGLLQRHMMTGVRQRRTAQGSDPGPMCRPKLEGLLSGTLRFDALICNNGIWGFFCIACRHEVN